MLPVKLDTINNIYGDEIGNISLYDFSRANIDDQNRIDHVTTVASICYGNNNAIGKESLYNRLAAEAKGLPSSSYEFIPVLLSIDRLDTIYSHYNKYGFFIPNVVKYGIVVKNKYVLTNYRALFYDYEKLKKLDNSVSGSESFSELLHYYNTEEECDIIRKYSYTFLTKMDMATSKQYNRHRISLQERSRRYVSGKRIPFQYYYEPKMLDKIDNELISRVMFRDHKGDELYDELLENGIKPESARRVLTLSMYTEIWANFNIEQIMNFFNMRLDSHAQSEIRSIAKAMVDLLDKHNINSELISKYI